MPGDRFRLAAKTDAMWSSTTSAATAGMVSATGDARRARVTLEGAGRFAFGARGGPGPEGLDERERDED